LKPGSEKYPQTWLRLRELPIGHKLWHLVPLLMPLGFLLIFLGASGPHDWMVPAGIGLLAIAVVDIAVIFPLVMARADWKRRRED
jgi:hypothetical protein